MSRLCSSLVLVATLGAVGCAVTGDAGSWFEEVAHERGLDFEHRSGHVSEHYMPEIVGGGAALFDMDNDGDLDVYLVQSGSLIEAFEKHLSVTADRDPLPHAVHLRGCRSQAQA